MFNKLLKKEWFRNTLYVFAGITIGVIFYPTKSVEQRVSKTYEEKIEKINESHRKEYKDQHEYFSVRLQKESETVKQYEKNILELKYELKVSQSKQKTQYYKIVRPDGTIEVKKYSESEVNESSKVITKIQQEFKLKIEELEKRWSSVHLERVEKIKKEFLEREQKLNTKIEQLEKTKQTKVNPKKFGLEFGYLSNKEYYGHFSYDFWGPMYLGLMGQTFQNNNNLGLGLGIRF
jgi:predicted RNase H-like nuclease (RuvC/YqgF family)